MTRAPERSPAALHDLGTRGGADLIGCGDARDAIAYDDDRLMRHRTTGPHIDYGDIAKHERTYARRRRRSSGRL